MRQCELVSRCAGGAAKRVHGFSEPSGLRWRARVERGSGRAYLLASEADGGGTLTTSDPDDAAADNAAIAEAGGGSATGVLGAGEGLVVAEEGHFMEAHCERCSELHSYPGNELLLCDGPECGAAWHLHCLRPKLAVVPVGDWLCPTCSTKRRAEMRLEEANSIEKILDERRRIDTGSESGRPSSSASPKLNSPLRRKSMTLEYLCKYRGRAHIHATWLTADKIAADGRLSLQRLQNYQKKRGPLAPRLSCSRARPCRSRVARGACARACSCV